MLHSPENHFSQSNSTYKTFKWDTQKSFCIIIANFLSISCLFIRKCHITKTVQTNAYFHPLSLMNNHCYFRLAGKQFTNNIFHSFFLKKVLSQYQIAFIWANYFLQRLESAENQNINHFISMPFITDNNKPVCKFYECPWCQIRLTNVLVELGVEKKEIQKLRDIACYPQSKSKKRVRFQNEITYFN